MFGKLQPVRVQAALGHPALWPPSLQERALSGFDQHLRDLFLLSFYFFIFFLLNVLRKRATCAFFSKRTQIRLVMTCAVSLAETLIFRGLSLSRPSPAPPLNIPLPTDIHNIGFGVCKTSFSTSGLDSSPL